LILSSKAKGFKSIRIPMTAYTRYSLGADGHYVIDSAWLARYKQVVDWAVDAGLYVMINLHHDSWIWLSDWDGNTSSEEYKRYVDLWTQLADYFKDEPNTVSFETINEPGFKAATGSISTQDKLNMINQAAYQAIRSSGGNNATRMIVMPTYYTSADVDKADATYNFIAGLNDPNIIATVHFYSDWVFTANIGITSFDEPLYTGVPDTARSHIDLLFDTLYSSFIAKGVGVVIGEYGWLSPDDGPAVMQPGEKVKYFEYLNYKASQYGVCPMIWPAAFDRVNAPYDWNPVYGPVLKADIDGQRSSYATGLNEIYIKDQKAKTNIQIPLTLNGNQFVGIAGLKDNEYSYDEATATVTLSDNFVKKALKKASYGTIADLVFQFSAGADWHQYLIKYDTPVFQTATGTTTDGITIPVAYNGSKVRRAAAFDESGNRVGGTTWFRYMHFGTYDGSNFSVDYNNGTFTLPAPFFNDSVKDGMTKITIEFFDGQIINYAINKSGTDVTGLGVVS
jgi:endoglucanase